jgi:hypothetical protein
MERVGGTSVALETTSHHGRSVHGPSASPCPSFQRAPSRAHTKQKQPLLGRAFAPASCHVSRVCLMGMCVWPAITRATVVCSRERLTGAEVVGLHPCNALSTYPMHRTRVAMVLSSVVLNRVIDALRFVWPWWVGEVVRTHNFATGERESVCVCEWKCALTTHASATSLLPHAARASNSVIYSCACWLRCPFDRPFFPPKSLYPTALVSFVVVGLRCSTRRTLCQPIIGGFLTLRRQGTHVCVGGSCAPPSLAPCTHALLLSFSANAVQRAVQVAHHLGGGGSGVCACVLRVDFCARSHVTRCQRPLCLHTLERASTVASLCCWQMAVASHCSFLRAVDIAHACAAALLPFRALAWRTLQHHQTRCVNCAYPSLLRTPSGSPARSPHYTTIAHWPYGSSCCALTRHTPHRCLFLFTQTTGKMMTTGRRRRRRQRMLRPSRLSRLV